MRSTAANVPDANIVHNRFHISKYLGEAFDKARRAEHREWKQERDSPPTGLRQLLLYNEENRDEDSYLEVLTIQRADLKTGRAWAIKENFQHFWTYATRDRGKRFFDRWYGWAIRSRLDPFVARPNEKGRGDATESVSCSIVASSTCSPKPATKFEEEPSSLAMLVKYTLSTILLLTLAFALVYVELSFTGVLLPLTLLVVPFLVCTIGLTAPSVGTMVDVTERPLALALMRLQGMLLLLLILVWLLSVVVPRIDSPLQFFWETPQWRFRHLL